MALTLLPGAACAFDKMPPLMLWSWQHNDDLDFIDPKYVGIAHFAGLLTVDGDKGNALAFNPALSSLSAPRAVYYQRAVRLQTRHLKFAEGAGGEAQMQALAAKVSERIVKEALKGGRRVSSVQVDFDALQSERAFYIALLGHLRSDLPEAVALSMTALASWTLADNWLEGVVRATPVQSVVPMFFSMGSGRPVVVKMLKLGQGSFSDRSFEGKLSPGFSLADPEACGMVRDRLDRFQAVYFFSSDGWNKIHFDQVQKLSGRVNGRMVR